MHPDGRSTSCCESLTESPPFLNSDETKRRLNGSEIYRSEAQAFERCLQDHAFYTCSTCTYLKLRAMMHLHHPKSIARTHLSQSMITITPRPFIVSIIFFDFSFDIPSFICFDALSTNFLLFIKLNPNILLISLMILSFAIASNDFSVKANKVFFCVIEIVSSSSTDIGAINVATAEKPPINMSGIFRRDWRMARLL